VDIRRYKRIYRYKYPTKEGYDGCLGYLEGIKHVCCGHGVNRPYIILENNKYIQFDDMYNLKKYFKNIGGKSNVKFIT